MKKITYVLAGASLLAIAGAASAEPVTLSAAEMDNVSAGTYVYSGVGLALAGSGAMSNLLGLTGSATAVDVQPVAGYVFAGGTSGALAVSTYNPANGAVNGAYAASAASAASSLF
ncbi:MAG: hypothetical protein Q7U38_12070 [Methylobacter sp.]|nr:hypothetical protein [Methylobacter sp.]MDP2099986.1 hypothetical protein [Methylobacter sp.]MDP2427329.1 hypothetical protein [Methylobacter sp.]MDP3053726.1 hypothetical protein [Methylobacter sp.]MDP3364226.1 hypothetical protein [Methylobacter sp.]